MRRPLVLLLAVGVLLLVVATAFEVGALGDTPPCTASSVAMSSDRTATDANNTVATLTLTLDNVLCGSYRLSLYDDQGNRLAYWSPDGYNTHSWSVAPANNQTRAYTAYVSLDTPNPGPPGSVSSSSSVTITNQGWIGHVTLTADRTSTDANNTTASLTLTLDRLLAGPYHLSLYDDQGNRVASWTADGYNTHSFSVAPANNQSRTYTAYVSQDTPTPGPPSNDVRSTSSVTITNQGWLGHVTLTTDRTATDANNTIASLTLTLDRQLASPYHLSLYDDQGNRVASWTADGYTTHSFSVAPANNQSRTYTAYVSQDTPTPGPPSSDVRSTSSVTITNQGWLGQVTLTTDRTATDANNTIASLTLTLDRQLAGPYHLSLYDDQGNRVANWSADGYLTHSWSVAPANNQTRTYTAYVSQDMPSPGPPSNDVRSTSSVTITNQGWIGSLQVSSNRTTVDSANPTATLTLTLDRQLAGPYHLSLYDDQGNRVANWSADGYLTHSWSVTPPLSQTRTYTAYVSQDTPNPGPPSNDVRADSGLTYVAGTLTALRIEGLNVADITSTNSDEEIELALSAWPLATHAEGSTLSDQALAYSGYVAGGLAAAYALEEVIGDQSAHSDLAAWIQGYFDPSEPAPEPTVVPDAPTGVLPPQDLNIPRTLEDVVTESILERVANRARSISREEARTIARQCIREVALAAIAPIDGKNPCQQLPIFVPGDTWPLTTAHDSRAIASNPAWAQLNYVKRSDRNEGGLEFDWFDEYAPCSDPRPLGQQCDEYPFFASAQSGPGPDGEPGVNQLEVLDATDNGRAGLLYAAHVTTCNLMSGGPTANPENPLGSRFLVVPLPFSGIPTIWWICGAQ